MTQILFYYFEFGGISFRGAEGNGYMELCYENIIMIWFSIIEKFETQTLHMMKKCVVAVNSNYA